MSSTTALPSQYENIKMSAEDRAFCEKLWAPAPVDHFAPVGRCRSTGKEVTLCYNAYGSPKDPCVLLIMGLGCPAPYWDSRFCRMIADHGFYVIRFDNRDVGLSTHFDEYKPPFILRLGVPRWLSLGEGKLPYTLKDMAADAIGLLDHLKVDAAHVVGCSMGGMIAQNMIIDYPGRIRSLCMHSTSTGVPLPKLSVLFRLLDKPKDDSVEEVINYKERFFKALLGNYRFPRYEFRLGLLLTHTRCNYEAGYMRHLAAIARGGDRTAVLQAKVNRRLQQRLAPIRGSGYVSLAKDIYHWATGLLKKQPSPRTAIAADKATRSSLAHAASPSTTATNAPAAADASSTVTEPKADPTAAASSGAAAKTGDWRNAANMDIPVLILHGGADPIIPVANAKKLATTLAGSKLVILPDMGHYFTAEVYKLLADEIVLNAQKGEALPQL